MDTPQPRSYAPSGSAASVLERTAAVLHLRNATASRNYVLFGTDDPDLPGYSRELTVDYFTWVDMGQPRTVTITVEPGDTLNEAL